ncbi:MAG: putative HD phosphohydrolase [Motiliproteus sp.]|jgi:predicted HD phosphohydrolase
MKTVDFINMADGTAEEYRFLGEQEAIFIKGLPGRIMKALAGLESSFSGYKISRLEHSLQSATRAYNDQQPTEFVVAALLHDIGDELAPHSHSEMAASILRPYVSEKIYWIVKYHGMFQMYYFAHHIGGDQNARDKYRDHIWYRDAVEFCELYDQNCFDPDYQTQSLEFFRPMVEDIFGKEPVGFNCAIERTGA